MANVYLALGVVCEVVATASLRMAVHGSRRWYAAVGLGYAAAFALLTLALAAGMGLGAAYGTWVAGGVALTALVSRVLFGEAFNKTMASGLGLIVAGVFLIELGAAC